MVTGRSIDMNLWGRPAPADSQSGRSTCSTTTLGPKPGWRRFPQWIAAAPVGCRTAGAPCRSPVGRLRQGAGITTHPLLGGRALVRHAEPPRVADPERHGLAGNWIARCLGDPLVIAAQPQDAVELPDGAMPLARHRLPRLDPAVADHGHQAFTCEMIGDGARLCESGNWRLHAPLPERRPQTDRSGRPPLSGGPPRSPDESAVRHPVGPAGHSRRAIRSRASFACSASARASSTSATRPGSA